MCHFFFHQRNHRSLLPIQQEHQQGQAHRNTRHCRHSSGDMDIDVVLCSSQSKPIHLSPSQREGDDFRTLLPWRETNSEECQDSPTSTGPVVEPRHKVRSSHCKPQALSALLFPLASESSRVSKRTSLTLVAHLTKSKFPRTNQENAIAAM